MSNQAPVFDIQRFSIHDGPGIRTLIFLKGCNFHCSWCQNPESQFNKPVLAFYGDRCQQSFECLKTCKEDAIQQESFRINYDKCTACGDCADVCAYDALKMIGEYMTPVQLFEKILADHTYYKASLGGVTFTGGEPTLYPRFVEQVVDLCDSRDIHTNLETAGSFSFEKWQPILKKLDLIYFDLKLIDPNQFATHIGKGYDTVMHNAWLLKEQDFPVEFRLPLVPGITDTDENIDGISEFLLTINVRNIHLLDYHNMGETKISVINGDQKKLGLSNYTIEARQQVEERLASNGVSVIE
jgi:pyruvate formate lyase activating enzyme